MWQFYLDLLRQWFNQYYKFFQKCSKISHGFLLCNSNSPFNSVSEIKHYLDRHLIKPAPTTVHLPLSTFLEKNWQIKATYCTLNSTTLLITPGWIKYRDCLHHKLMFCGTFLSLNETGFKGADYRSKSLFERDGSKSCLSKEDFFSAKNCIMTRRSLFEHLHLVWLGQKQGRCKKDLCFIYRSFIFRSSKIGTIRGH